MCFAPQLCALFEHVIFQKSSEHGVLCTFWLGNVLRATTACTFSTSQLRKVVRTCCVLCILTWKCASRHNFAHFLNMSSSKSAPSMVCFVHFDLEMCFAPQRCALFRHLNFQKVVRTWCALCILTWKCASHATTACNCSSLIWPHGPAPAALACLLFDPPEPQICGKHSVSRLCYLFVYLHLLSSYPFSSLIFSLPLFSSLTLPISACPSFNIVGSLTSKLPSDTTYHDVTFYEYDGTNCRSERRAGP